MLETILASGAVLAGGGTVLAESGSSDVVGVLLPFGVGPAVFFGVYVGIYRHYRNTDKRHRFEREVGVAVGNLETRDAREGHRTRQRNRRMAGANEGAPLERVRRISVR